MRYTSSKEDTKKKDIQLGPSLGEKRSKVILHLLWEGEPGLILQIVSTVLIQAGGRTQSSPKRGQTGNFAHPSQKFNGMSFLVRLKKGTAYSK